MPLSLGLNPYGLTWTLGLQGAGTPRGNPAARGLAGFLEIGEALRAEVMEIYVPWLAALDETGLAALRDRLAAQGVIPVVSGGITMPVPAPQAMRIAVALGARTIRYGLSPVLEGARAAQGDWPGMQAAIAAHLAEMAPRAADLGLVLAIENHQDFRAVELAEMCEANGPGLGITFDTGNALAVAEAPLDFLETVLPHLVHLHLKDYRVQPTAQGWRLVRCALGDGAVPFAAIAARVGAVRPGVTSVLEPGALEARHIRWLTPGWWQGYPALEARRLAAAIAAARVKALDPDEDARTPWEMGEDRALGDWETTMIARSDAQMRAAGFGAGRA